MRQVAERAKNICQRADAAGREAPERSLAIANRPTTKESFVLDVVSLTRERFDVT